MISSPTSASSAALSDNTIVSYEADLKRLRAYLANRAVTSADAITGDTLIAHLRDLRAQGLASSSIARHLATLRAFGRFLVHFGFTENNPAELLERPVTWKQLPRGDAPQAHRQAARSAR